MDDDASPRRKSTTGRKALIALVAIIAAAYYFLPEETGPGTALSAFPGGVQENDPNHQSNRVAVPANLPGAGRGVHLVDFWATWCGPCTIQEPIISRVAAQYSGAVKVSRVDVDANANLTDQFGVQSVPTIIIFKDGREAARFIGVTDEEQLQQTIARLIH